MTIKILKIIVQFGGFQEQPFKKNDLKHEGHQLNDKEWLLDLAFYVDLQGLFKRSLTKAEYIYVTQLYGYIKAFKKKAASLAIPHRENLVSKFEVSYFHLFNSGFSMTEIEHIPEKFELEVLDLKIENRFKRYILT